MRFGFYPRSGFIHVDLAPAPHVDHVADVRNLDFIATGSADLVYACHVLEHFGRLEFKDVLREWHRLLKPGGVLGVVTVKVRLAVAPAVSVAVSVIDQLPTTPGMPLKTRVNPLTLL